ncbi:CENPE type kinesin-like protein [Volvox carteri f. nagariensis]|uniref:Kinesin-like protein n=1 Tax=Volvox carteri f. nagariensis TaxID=3068 RepID=D8TYR8_VOLCA|nr:CENPE type kinesin-like protein [Volvox carteri f. nagariensis]EFJ47441.1 CENPE type kinesin-like protein [Volvox carteri f. nagariensis]|eukprot:XP_002951630.1 CENPE type kinesin-like protein [Volvox carteri f. nagariensis]
MGTPRNGVAPSELNGSAQPPGKTEKVWVGVRIRPLLPHEKEAKEAVAWTAGNQSTLTCLAEEKNAYQQSTYQYDRVFGERTTSEEVYASAAQPMVRSAMKGYNCTLFAYGQTGSGKTTTMRSVMRHAAKDIFNYIAHSRDREFMLKMCAIEVYNEVVHDLFVDTDTNLKISDDKDRGPVVVDLTEQSIESEEHLLKMLKAVEGRRQVRETRMNQKSSRSHLVVRLYVESRAAPFSTGSLKDLAPVLSTINFVDLAGSERLSQASITTCSRGGLLLQASNINVSLLTLGKVIRALGKRGDHVPYRESNLTRILQPSLSGNSRMAIVCTLSPAAGSVENSRAALHFANHAKAVTMRPVMNEVRNEQALIHKMEAEIVELRRRLVGTGGQAQAGCWPAGTGGLWMHGGTTRILQDDRALVSNLLQQASAGLQGCSVLILK